MVRCSHTSFMSRRQTGMRLIDTEKLIAHAIFTRFPSIVRYLFELKLIYVHIPRKGILLRASNWWILIIILFAIFIRKCRKLNSILRIQYTSVIFFYNRDKRIFDSIPLLKLIILQLCSHIKE